VRKNIQIGILQLIFLMTIGNVLAQEEPKIIEIIQAGGSTQDQFNFPGANILIKKEGVRVHLLHEGALIKSDISYFYPKQNFFKANGEIVFTQGDSLRMTCDKIEYKKDEKEQITRRYDTLVFGKENESLKHALASCCNAIPGDPVFGFITINEGVKVHKKDCPNALSLQSNFAYRIIKAKWVDSSSDEFTAILKLSGIDNMGIVSEVTQSISNNMSVNINKLSFDSEDGIFTGLISVSVKNKTILNRLVNNLLKLKGVDKVLRE
jgi:(p)ppGpp synthase/HD superfamily hydrolase